MDGIKFESNNIISLYTKNDSECSGGLLVSIFYITFILLLLLLLIR